MRKAVHNAAALTNTTLRQRSVSAIRFLHLSAKNHASAVSPIADSANSFNTILHSPQSTQSKEQPDDLTFPLFRPPSIFPLPLQSSDATGTFSQHSLYPSSAAAEQLAVLDACLRSNQLSRAKVVWSRLRKLHETESALGPVENGSEEEQAMKPTKLSDIVPPSIHVAFLQAFFRSALAKKAYSPMETEISEAWAWFDMLVKQGDQIGSPQAGAFATMIKGAIVYVLSLFVTPDAN